jgi:pantoate kinase
LSASDAVSPAGISSFFEICRVDLTGKPLTDPLFIGARGGGFALKRGVRARVLIRKSSKTRVSIRINSKLAPEAKTTLWAIDHLMQENKTTLDVKVNLRVNVPIGAGYGTSAAGTAASCLALADAAHFPVTFNEIGRLTHVAEVVNQTGLGTASAIVVGGFVLVTEPGAPGIGIVDRLPFPTGNSIVCACLDATPTENVLSQANIANRVNPAGRSAIEAITRNPRLTTFLSEARTFSIRSGFQTFETSRLIDLMVRNGAVGAAQNMIGKAVHGVAENDVIERIVRQVRKNFPAARIFVSQLDDRGVRLVGA